MNALTINDFQPLTLDLLLVFAGLVVLALDVLMPPGRKRGLGVLTGVMLAGIFVVSFFVDTHGAAMFGAYQGGDWALFFKRLFLAIGAVVTLGALDHVDHAYPERQGELYLMLLSTLLGMTLLPGARDFILLLVSFELMGIPLAIMAAYAKTEDKSGPDRHGAEGALKLYLASAVSTAITALGLSFIYGMSGTTVIADVAAAPGSPLLTLGMLTALAGMSFKIGAVPFHMWVPDTYEAAPTPIVAYLSVAPKAAGFAALTAVLGLAFKGDYAVWLPLLLAVIVVTLLVGNLLALPQTNVKRLLAYSGVAQIGYMLMAVAAGTHYGTAVLLFYLAGYAATNVGVFLVVHAVVGSHGDADLRAFRGLHKRAPGLALALLLFLLSLGGIPFVVGFWAKLYVFLAAYEAGLWWLVLLGACLAVLALFYYMRIAREAYMNDPETDEPVYTPLALRAGIAVCLLLVVGMGAWPRPFVDSALAASRAFF